MTYSNWTKALLGALFAFQLSACTKEKGKSPAEQQMNALGTQFSEIPDAQTPYSQNATFFVDDVKSLMTNTYEFDDLGFPRVNQYSFQACFNDVMKKARMGLRQFEVVDGKGNRLPRVADQNGCIYWEEKIEFDYYSPEKYYPITRLFSSHEIGDAWKATFYLNPWEKSITYNTWNMRAPAANTIARVNGSANGAFSGKLEIADPDNMDIMRFNYGDMAHLRLQNITLTYDGMDENKFEIDKLLNLYVAQGFYIDMSPSIARRGINVHTANAAAIKGDFDLKVVLLKIDDSNRDITSFNNYIAHFEERLTMDPKQGYIRKRVTLKFPDISALSTRMQVLVRISAPKVRSAYLRPTYLVGRLDTLQGSGTITLNELEPLCKQDPQASAACKFYQADSDAGVGRVNGQSLDKIIATHIEEAKKEKQKGYDQDALKLLGSNGNVLFLKRTDIEKLVEVQKFRKISPTPIQDIAQNPTIVQEALQKLYDPQRKSVLFHDSKSGYSAEFIHDIVPDSAKVDTEYLMAPENYSVSADLGVSANNSIGYDVSAAASLNPVDLISLVPGVGPFVGRFVGALAEGVGFKLGVGGSWKRGYSRTAGLSTKVSQTVSITAQRRDVIFKGRTQKCIMHHYSWNKSKDVKWYKPWTWWFPLEAEKKPKDTVIVCEEPGQVKEMRESYYLVSDAVDTNMFMDGKSINYHKWLMFFRGSDAYGLFRYGIAENSIYDITQTMNRQIDRSRAIVPESVYNRITQVYPGVLSSAKNPSEIGLSMCNNKVKSMAVQDLCSKVNFGRR